MPADNIARPAAAAQPHPSPLNALSPRPQFDLLEQGALAHRPAASGPLSTQYLLIDSFHVEIIAAYLTMSNAAHRDRLEGRTVPGALALARPGRWGCRMLASLPRRVGATCIIAYQRQGAQEGSER